LWQYLQDKTSGTNSANPQTKIIDRIAQRIQEIYPQFPFNTGSDESNDNSPIAQLLNNQAATIDMAQDAYIYLDDRITATNPTPSLQVAVVYDSNPLKQVNTAANGSTTLPGWLQAEISAAPTPDGTAVLGKTIFYGIQRRITTEPISVDAGNYVENVPGDWGYTNPYTNANNPPPGATMVDVYLNSRYVFQPCSGYQGQLAVLQLQQFINHDCSLAVLPSASVVYQAGATPEVCPCTTYPTGSNPCPGGNCTANTPGGWLPSGPDGGNLASPAPKGLPNCSHTGAC
jgi:hypothetical protein